MTGALQSLTPRELAVFRRVVHGWTYAEISADLHISPKTISTFRTRAGRKLGVTTARAWVNLALDLGGVLGYPL